jgi:spermidine/putrescine transport system permease protein
VATGPGTETRERDTRPLLDGLSAPVRDALLGAGPFLVAFALGIVPLCVLLVESLDLGAFPDLGAVFASYTEVGTSVYLPVVGRSLLVGVAITVGCLAVAYPVTYWLAHRCPARYRLALLVTLTLPLWLNYVVLNYTWVWILARGGLLNYLLRMAGLVGGPLDLLYTNVSLALGFLYIYLPYVVLTMYVSMERLDGQLIEAARDLGASDLRVFVDVVLPQTLAGAFAGTLIVYARIAGAFATPEILGGPRNQLVAQLITDAFLEFIDYPFAAALSFVFLAVVAAGFALGATRRDVREELRRW